MLVAGTSVCAMIIAVRIRRARVTQQLLFTQPDALADDEPAPNTLAGICALVGGIIVAIDLIQIGFGFTPLAGSVRLTVLFCAIINLSAAWALFALLLDLRRPLPAVAAISLLTAGLGLLAVSILPSSQLSESAGLADRARVIVMVMACLLPFWCWLEGVWQQQLDHGRAWTTSGWFCVHMTVVLAGSGIAGLLFALIACGPIRESLRIAPMSDNGITFWMATVHIVQTFSFLLVWRIRRAHVFLILALVAAAVASVQILA